MPIFIKVFLVSAIVTTGSILHGSIGIGLGLIAAPVLAVIDPLFVPGPLLLSGLVLTTLMAYRERQAIDSFGVRTALLGRVIGTLVAAAVMAILPTRQMSILFGVLVLSAVLLSVSKWQIQITSWSVAGVGIISGFMSTTSAVGGPPMALLYQNASGARLRSTLSGYLVFGTIISLISLAVVGRFGYQELGLTLFLLPGVLVGFLFSNRILPFIDRRNRTKVVVLIVSVASALVVIVRALV